MRKKILFVPGKNPKPEPTLHHELLQRSLLEGVRRRAPSIADDIENQQAFELCPWNYTFYGEHLDFSNQLASVDKLLTKYRASVQDKICATTWRIKLSRLIYQIGDRFPWLIDLLADDHVKALLDGSTQYFENDGGRADLVRQVFHDAISPYIEQDYKIMVIAHSMGSIIAYEALQQLSLQDRNAKHVDLFLTMGSAMGLNYVQERLQSFSESDSEALPSNISSWHNVSARGDLVSVDKTLADDFELMTQAGLVDEIVDHTKGVYHWYKTPWGYNFHSSYGYLVGPTVAKIIAQWWQDEDGE